MAPIRTGWVRSRKWWFHYLKGEQPDIAVKVTNEGDEKLGQQSAYTSELQLSDFLQYATDVYLTSVGSGLMVEFADVLETAHDPVPFLEELTFKYIDLSVINPALEPLRREGMSKISFLSFNGVSLDGEEAGRVAAAIASADLPSLKVLDDAKALSYGKVPSLIDVNVAFNRAFVQAIQSGKLKNLTNLNLHWNKIGDDGLIALVEAIQVGAPKIRCFGLESHGLTDKSLQILAEAIESGRLKSFQYLYLSPMISTKVAETFISAMAKEENLLLDIRKMKSWNPPVKYSLRELLWRDLRNTYNLRGMGAYTSVSASFSKVYVCGNPEVGKTTLRRTLEMGRKSILRSWREQRSNPERTRGIDVSRISSKDSKPGEDPITLLVWDMAGQEDYHLLHNAFFPDLDSAEGNATTFVIVCSFKKNLEESQQQLDYWLRFIASSSQKNTQNLRHVLVVLNNFVENVNVETIKYRWKTVLEDQREKFATHLEIQANPIIEDVRKRSSVKHIKKRLLEYSRNSLRYAMVPKVCQFIQEKLGFWSETRKQFPVLHWEDFVTEVRQSSSEQWSTEALEKATRFWNGELWPEKILTAAASYLNEAGALIFIDKKFPSDWGIANGKLVVLNPTWFCREVVGSIYLHQDMGFPAERLFRMKVDSKTGSISVAEFKKFFKSLLGFADEWSDTGFEDIVAILLWLGLCYQGRNQDLYIPSLIHEDGPPGGHWSPRNTLEHKKDQWVMGFAVAHQDDELTLAPLALWHRFQVELAQTPKYNDHPDHDFVCGRYFMTFSVDYMDVLIKVNVNEGIPTFGNIGIFVKPLNVDVLDGNQRKQCQVDLAGDLVEVLLRLWEEVCPAVGYLQRVVWPWPVCKGRSEVMPGRNVDVGEVQKWVREHGPGRTMQWKVGLSDTITEDQLLSTKVKRGLVEENLHFVRQTITEAVDLRILPSDILLGEGSPDEGRLATEEIEDEMLPIISPGVKLVLSKLDKIDMKLDQADEKLNKRLESMEGLIREGFSKQRQLLHKIENTGNFFLQDRQRKCPRFIYLGKKDSGSWMTLKEVFSKMSPYVTVRLHFACEARYNDYRPHPVQGQPGLDVSNLKDWAEKIVPWLRVSLTVLYISAKIGANVVAPGLGLVMPNFGDWQQASSLAEGLALATGFTKEELDKHIDIGMELGASDRSWDPRELCGKSIEAMSELLEKKLTPKAYKDKLGLRKVCLDYGECSEQEIAWICTECFEKYERSTISIRQL